MQVLNNLEQVTDFSEDDSLLKFHPATKSQMKYDFNTRNLVVFKNSQLVIGLRTIPDGNKAGLHVQGYRGDVLRSLTDDAVSLTKKLGLPYVWFSTANTALANEINNYYPTQAVENDDATGETVYRVAV